MSFVEVFRNAPKNFKLFKLIIMKKNKLLSLLLGFAMVTVATAQLKVLQNGNTIVGTGNSSFPYSQTQLTVNGSASLKSTLEIMNKKNTSPGWGGQIRFTANDLSGINHIIADNGVDEMILYPGFHGNSSPSRKISLYGNLDVYGYSRLLGGGYFSDKRLKENIENIQGGLDKIIRLQGVYFNWKKQAISLGEKELDITESLPKGRQLGFIAQAVEEVVPEIVSETKNGYKSVEYHTITALLVEAVKEQQDKIKALEAKIEALSYDDKKNDRGKESLKQEKMSPKVGANLLQNIPNPFSSITEVRYTLPQAYKKGVLVVSDLQGKEIKSFKLKSGNNQTLEISSNNLENGLYLYSMIVDGKILETKRFVISK